MQSSFQQLIKNLQGSKFKPLNLIYGEEPFQIEEIIREFKNYFGSCELFDTESLEINELIGSLELPAGMWKDEPKGRLILCRNIEKLSHDKLETLTKYFENPVETTCLVMTANHIDKRKHWVKTADQGGDLFEVKEPYERDFIKWQSYFEKKVGKSIDPKAWQLLIYNAQLKLSLVWADLQNISLFVGDKNNITEQDVIANYSKTFDGDVFSFVDEVVFLNSKKAFEKFYYLKHNEENEVKILSLVVRQFKLIKQCFYLLKQGISDPKALSQKLGVHSFFCP
jgi:DNA polymerase-3 subunit delta